MLVEENLVIHFVNKFHAKYVNTAIYSSLHKKPRAILEILAEIWIFSPQILAGPVLKPSF